MFQSDNICAYVHMSERLKDGITKGIVKENLYDSGS